MSPAETHLTPELQEDRTAAILSYITILGFIVAIVIHSGQKTAIGAFHLRQVLGMIIIGIAVSAAAAVSAVMMAVIPVIGPLFAMAIWGCLWLGGLALWLIGLIAAIQGRQTPVPLIGPAIQKWFANTFT